MSAHLDVQIERLSFDQLGRPLIENLAFDIPYGAFVSLLGPSGSGKSTLLRIIAGLETNYRGHVLLNGNRVVAPSRSIQCVFQDILLFPWRSASENLRFAASPSMPTNEVEELIEQYLGRTAIDPRGQEMAETPVWRSKNRLGGCARIHGSPCGFAA